MRIIMLGDIVGRAGRLAVRQQLPVIHERFKPDVVLANAENSAHGSGLTADQYRKLCNAGIDGITLGDHALRKREIVKVLEEQTNIIRPANMPRDAPGKRWMAINAPAGGLPPVYVITLLGNMFMGMNTSDPFACIDDLLGQLPGKDQIIIVEMHAEVTSEKQAMGWHLNGKVAAVLGTHTHVPTADAEILLPAKPGDRGRTGFMCDLGMCGSHCSIIGRKVEPVLTNLRTGLYVAFDVADEDPRINGMCLEVDPQTGHAISIEQFAINANPQKPPFVAG